MPAIVGAASFYFVPWWIGQGIRSLIELITQKRFRRSIVGFYVSYAIGALVLFLEAIFVNIFVQGEFTGIYKITVGTVVILALIIQVVDLFVVKGPERNGFSKKDVLRSLGVFVAGIALAGIVYWIWRYNSPFNTTLNWDIYHHQLLSQKIASGNFDTSTLKLSDTFQFLGYSTLFHLLLAIPQMFISMDTLTYWWFLELFHLVSVVFMSYSAGKSFTNSRYIGLLSMVVGAFTFESVAAYTSLFLIPQNLSALIGVALILYTIEQHDIDLSIIDINRAFLIAAVVLTHYVIGSYIAFLYVVTIVFLKICEEYRIKKLENGILVAATVILGIVFVLINKIDLSYLNRGEASFFNFSLMEKYRYMKDFYGFSFLIFVPLGILHLFLKQSSPVKKLLFMLVAGNLTLVISQIPYSLKFYAVARFFVHVLIAYGIYIVTKNFNKYLKVASLIMLSGILFIVFSVNQIKFKQIPQYHESFTHVSPFEIQAASFLKTNYANTKVLLVSEPATMHILEGLSDINTPGGAYTSVENRQQINKIFYNRDSKKMQFELFKITDSLEASDHEKVLLVVSGRFIHWQLAEDKDKYGIQWNVWTPFDLSYEQLEEYEFIDFISRQTDFKEVFRNDGLVIFEIERGNVFPNS